MIIEERERDSTYLEEELRSKRLVLKINPYFKFCNLRFQGEIKRENGKKRLCGKRISVGGGF